MYDPGDVVVLSFPGAHSIKRRPAVVVSSSIYHASRPDLIVGLITSRTGRIGPTDYALQHWSEAGLRVPSVFRSFLATVPQTTRPVLVGHLCEQDWEGVCACLTISLAAITLPESQSTPHS